MAKDKTVDPLEQARAELKAANQAGKAMYKAHKEERAKHRTLVRSKIEALKAAQLGAR